jgi:hypothetical protein
LPKEAIPLDKIRECLERSGYLMESRLVRTLTDRGFFVEPNQSLHDPRTGKFREIDLVAEYYDDRYLRQKICVKTYFVIEAINNRFPFVLMTERPWTPNVGFESYIKYICTPEPSPFTTEIDLYEERGADWKNLYSQYCALTKKSSSKELMATHPDDVYSSLLKLSEYIEGEMEVRSSNENLLHDEYWRLFFWNPILVLSGQLVIAHLCEDGETELEEAVMGRLEFNWHGDGQPRTTVIEVVTENYFYERLASVVAKDQEIEAKLFELRQQAENTGNTQQFDPPNR